MAAIDDVDELIEQCHLALDEIMKGSPEGYKKLYSRRDDVTLANRSAFRRTLIISGHVEEENSEGQRPRRALPLSRLL